MTISGVYRSTTGGLLVDYRRNVQCSTLTLAHLPWASKIMRWASVQAAQVARLGKWLRITLDPLGQE